MTQFTLNGDLDGMTVSALRELLSEYEDSDRIEVRTETDFGGFGRGPVEREYFVIVSEDTC